VNAAQSWIVRRQWEEAYAVAIPVLLVKLWAFVITMMILSRPKEDLPDTVAENRPILIWVAFTLLIGLSILEGWLRAHGVNERTVIDERGLTRHLEFRSQKVPFTQKTLPARDLWGVRVSTHSIDVLRRPNYEIAFTIPSDSLEAPDERERFFANVRAMGGKVIFRADSEGN
jgi:hypothetical protein